MPNQRQNLILGIDSSCDETSLALYEVSEQKLLANVISSQVKVHAPYGGVVPELASRQHIENLPAVFATVLREASVAVEDLSSVAVTVTPGLMGCLLVGVSFAKALAARLKIPLIPINHLEAHLFSPFIGGKPALPFLGLVVSGGHTAFYGVKNPDEITLLGQTVDDAVGELYDKTAKMMGLGYPGGPIVDQMAQSGNPKAFAFAVPKVKMGREFMSFSGLKTAVNLTLRDMPERSAKTDEDLCASLQKTVVQSLLEKACYFLESGEYQTLAISGGVAMNSLLRARALELGADSGLSVCVALPEHCTDNAAMVAYLAQFRKPASHPGVVLTQASQKIQAREIFRGRAG